MPSTREERIRVLMVGPYPASPDRIDGGVASAITYLSQALVTDPRIQLIGVRIARNGDESREHLEFGWPVVDLSLGRLGLSTLYRRQKSRLRDVIRQYRPHVVHGQGADLAGFLAVGSGLPAVVTVHGLLGECAKFQTEFAARTRAVLSAMLTERQTIRRARHLIAISPYVTQYYAKSIAGRVHDVPNAIAESFFRVERVPEKGRFLFAGRIANGKGLIELLHAVARNPEHVTKIVLAGATPDRAYGDLLREETRRLKLTGRVSFAGLLDDPALLNEFARAEALVHPSYQETAPMVIQQAMAAGLAVIATDVGGIPFQIQHEETGLLFEAGNIDQLAGLFRRIGSDPSLGRRLGEDARAVASVRYQAEAVARATICVYHAVISSARRHVA